MRSRRSGLALREGRKAARIEGFTLVEMLVVVLVIGLLLTLSGYAYAKIVERSLIAKTKAFIVNLDSACAKYRVDHRAWPPASPYEGSQNLHYYLGRPWMVQVQHGYEPIREQKAALHAFTMADLVDAGSVEPTPPAFVKDAWGRKIGFASPGRHNTKGVDIWSLGPDEKDPADDISNWKVE